MDKEVYGKQFRILRAELLHDGERCWFCGYAEATEAHHRAFYQYPCDEDLRLADLTAMCSVCHKVMTSLRRFIRGGFSLFRFKVAMDRLFQDVMMRPDDVGNQIAERVTPSGLPEVHVVRAVRENDQIEVVVRLPMVAAVTATRKDDQEASATRLPSVAQADAVRGDDPELPGANTTLGR